MSSWRDKDDLDLSSEDIGAMLESGEPAEARGPRVPGGKVVSAVPSYGGSWSVHAPGVTVTGAMHTSTPTPV